MSVRTYNPSVRVGNWNEDIQLEEDTLKDFLERKERGELLIQQSAALNESAFSKVDLSVSRDGKVHFGDIVILVNPAPANGDRGPAVISISGEGVTASGNVTAASRTALRIVSIDGTAEGTSLKYEQPFALATVQGGMYLYSDRASFSKNYAKKSRHNAVMCGQSNPKLAEWKARAFNPQIRMELEYTDVPANRPIIIAHRTTNQNLCLEKDHSLRTPFGQEFEVSGFTKLDSHKAEEDGNHWMLQCSVPGDDVMPMTPQN